MSEQAKQTVTKQGLLHDLLTRDIDENGELRKPATFHNCGFGFIPKDWTIGGIMDVAPTDRQAIVTGPFGAQLGSADFVDSGVPVLRIGNVQWGYIDLDELLFVTPMKAESLDRYRIRTGDLLFARQGATTGRNALADACVEGYLINYHIIRVATDPTRCDPVYLHAAINSEGVQRQVDREKGRGTREGVSSSTLRAFRFPLPPLAEQQRIAEILDTFDKTIRKTEQLIAKLKLAKQGLLHDLLTRGIDDNGELRDPERHPEQFKDSPLGRIPKGWEVKQLGSLLEAIHQGWSPDCASTPARQGEWGVLKTTAVQWSGFSSDANKALPGHLTPRPDIEVHEGDVLLTRAGPASRVGVVSFVAQTQPKLMLSDKLYRLVPNATLHPRFLALGLSGQQSQHHLSSMKAGLAETQENISHAIVRALRILHPPLKEQDQIVGIVDALESRTAQENLLIAKLHLLKTALMEDLLTGRVRTTHLEPAK
jgi:type I restriction enzyme, S subunit